jgi:RNA polymerase sigma factor (sigma-70 family)
LAKLAQDGDTAAWNELITRHYDALKQHARWACDRLGLPQSLAEPDDLVHEAICKGSVGLDRLRAPSRLLPWLKAIIWHLALTLRVKADGVVPADPERSNERDGQDREAPTPPDTPENIEYASYLRRQLERAAGKLNELHQGVAKIILDCAEKEDRHLTVNEIARATGTSHKKARRCRERIAKLFRRAAEKLRRTDR